MLLRLNIPNVVFVAVFAKRTACSVCRKSRASTRLFFFSSVSLSMWMRASVGDVEEPEQKQCKSEKRLFICRNKDPGPLCRDVGCHECWLTCTGNISNAAVHVSALLGILFQSEYGPWTEWAVRAHIFSVGFIYCALNTEGCLMMSLQTMLGPTSPVWRGIRAGTCSPALTMSRPGCAAWRTLGRSSSSSPAPTVTTAGSSVNTSWGKTVPAQGAPIIV